MVGNTLIENLINQIGTKVKTTFARKDDVEEENTRLRSDIDGIGLTDTEEGTSIDLSDSAEARFSHKGSDGLEVCGNSTQETTTGKNKLPNNVTNYTHNGIEYKTNIDRTIKVNGTATDVSYVNIIDGSTVTLPAGTYKLTGCPSGGSDGTYRLDIDNGSRVKEYGSGATFTLSEETTLQNVRIRIASGTSLSNVVFKPMLRLASITDSTYEPYTGRTSKSKSRLSSRNKQCRR